jgi:hypothetical protein
MLEGKFSQSEGRDDGDSHKYAEDEGVVFASFSRICRHFR